MVSRLLDPVAGHPAITLFGELAFRHQERKGTAEINLGASLAHDIALAEIALQLASGIERKVLLLGDLVRRCTVPAAASTATRLRGSGHHGSGTGSATTRAPAGTATGSGPGSAAVARGFRQ